MLTFTLGARADRIVLAPRGLVQAPKSASVEWLASSRSSRTNLGYLTLGSWREDLGLELEAERVEQPGRRAESFSLQYSLTGNAFKDQAALTVGIRDALRSGRERQAVFVTATRSSGFRQSEHPILKEWMVHLGLGSSSLGGLFAGAEVRLPLGVRIAGEVVGLKVNASASLGAGRNGSIGVYSINGRAYYGASFVLRK